MRRLVAVLLLLSLGGVGAVAAPGLQDAGAAAAAPAPVRDGPTLFRERGCAHCHEIRGMGGEKGPDLSGVGRRLNKDAIQRQIVQGGGEMPAFGEALPADEIAVLTDYLSRCKAKQKKGKGEGAAAPSR